jgi:hypothetical protein
MKELRKRVERGHDAIVAYVKDERVERGHSAIVVGVRNERKRREREERKDRV